jgi:hypothetical protein
MKVKIVNQKKQKLTWEELNYGDVFEYGDDIDDVNSTSIGMKICDCASNLNVVDYLLDLYDYEIYSDVHMYNIIEVIECSLIKDKE